MQTLPLTLLDGHLFVTIGADTWLLDSGSPLSFGRAGARLLGRPLDLPDSVVGLSAATLSELVGRPCVGLLGMDLLQGYDLRFDLPAGRLTVTDAELAWSGEALPIDERFGIPVLTAEIAAAPHRVFFDTGAQISYLQDDGITAFPFLHTARDYYPGFGTFETDLHAIPARLGAAEFTLHCGMLPPLLGMALMMADVDGIVGNSILAGRRVALLPRRRLLVLEDPA